MAPRRRSAYATTLVATTVATLLATLLVAGCGDADDADPEVSAPAASATDAGSPTTGSATVTTPSLVVTVGPVTPPGPTDPTVPAPSPSVLGEVPGGTARERAIADLAARQGAQPSAITVVSEENVVWPDSALGCPEPGMNYMQVLTDGVRIVLELDGVEYAYHGGGSRDVFLCPSPGG